MTPSVDGCDRWRAGWKSDYHGGRVEKVRAVAKTEPQPERLSEPFKQEDGGRGACASWQGLRYFLLCLRKHIQLTL